MRVPGSGVVATLIMPKSVSSSAPDGPEPAMAAEKLERIAALEPSVRVTMFGLTSPVRVAPTALLRPLKGNPSNVESGVPLKEKPPSGEVKYDDPKIVEFPP